MSNLTPGQPPIQWCEECGRYYSPSAPHECFGKEIKKNREQLESWLGKGNFKIKEDA